MTSRELPWAVTSAIFVWDDTEISRQHVLLEICGTDAMVQDLGSTNGTHVDGSRVTQAPLQNRSEFRIGNHELMFVVTERELDLV